jgi:hypothetical protein
MPGASAGTEAAVAAAAARIQAVRASGVVVQLEPEAFESVVNRMERPLVVRASGGFLSSRWHYLAPYRGLAFYAKSNRDLSLPGNTEIVEAKKMWVPS